MNSFRLYQKIRDKSDVVRISSHQHDLGKAVDTTKLSVFAFIEYSGDALSLCSGFRAAPSFAGM